MWAAFGEAWPAAAFLSLHSREGKKERARHHLDGTWRTVTSNQDEGATTCTGRKDRGREAFKVVEIFSVLSLMVITQGHTVPNSKHRWAGPLKPEPATFSTACISYHFQNWKNILRNYFVSQIPGLPFLSFSSLSPSNSPLPTSPLSMDNSNLRGAQVMYVGKIWAQIRGNNCQNKDGKATLGHRLPLWISVRAAG